MGKTLILLQESKNKGKRLEELVKGSLDYERYEIRQAFGRQFPDTDHVYYDLAEIFPDHVMVKIRDWTATQAVSIPLNEDEYFKVNFAQSNEGIMFDARDQWQVVELTYKPKSLTESVWMLEESAKGARKIHIKNLMTAGEINGNNRRYPASVLQAAVEELKTHLHESAGQGRLMLLGEVEHPSDKGARRANLMETVIRWTDVTFDGRDVNVSGLLATETEGGRHIQALAAIGVVPGGSIRGYGSTETVTDNGNKFEEVNELHITGIDVVTEASFGNSQTILESAQAEEPGAEDIRMNLLEKLMALLEARPDLFNVSADQLKVMAEPQLQTLWGKISEAMKIDPAKVDVNESLKVMIENSRKFEEGQRLQSIESAIAEATKELPYGVEGNKSFVESIKAAKPQDAAAVNSLVEAKRAEYDKLFAGRKLEAMGWSGSISGISPVLESQTGTPEFARVSFELNESLSVSQMRERRDLRKPVTAADYLTIQILKRFDELHKDRLIAEARQWQEASITSDLNLPYSVSRTIIEEVFPTLVSAGIFDIGLMNNSPERLFYETFAGETGYAGTVTGAALVADLSVWVSLAQKRLTPGSVVVTNEAENVTYVEGTDYVIDYANGKFMALTTITDNQALLITYNYTAIRKGEMQPIERGKITLAYKDISAAADRLADQISSEAIVFSRSQLGMDLVQRTLTSLIRQTRIKIDQGMLYQAYSAVKTVSGNSGGTWTRGTTQAELAELVRLIGLAKIKVYDRYYSPDFILASAANAETLSNWEGFKRDGWPNAVLNAAGFAGSVKSLPIFASTEFAEDTILVGNRQLVMHRIFQPMIVKGPFPTYHTDGKLIAADQYYTEEYNATEAPVAEKGSYIVIDEAGS